MADGESASEDRERSRVERLLVGREAIARQHVRGAVTLVVGQALFTVTLSVLVERYGLPPRNLPAFAATLVVLGLLGAVLTGARDGGLLVAVGLVLAPLAGAVPVTVIRAGAVDEGLVATALMVGGLGVWAGVLGFALGVAVRRVRARRRDRPDAP